MSLLDVKGRTILQLVKEYFEDSIYVNRKYQRKLVWTLDEKRNYIESLLREYPTPSIMLNKKVDCDDHEIYDIVDGVQRLDAIISFVTCQFDVQYEGKKQFCDIDAFPSVRKHVNNKDIKQREPKMDLDKSLTFAECEIPVVMSNHKEEDITEIFCRINSNGRKLSRQDLRQASIVDPFSELVRRCSIRIRGDYTYMDEVNLCDMRKISISNDGLDYGINIGNIFWMRHGIITEKNIRQSRDEEIIASILINYLQKTHIRVQAEQLEQVYRAGSKRNTEINEILANRNIDEIEDSFAILCKQLDTIFKEKNTNFSVALFSEYPKPSGKDDIFQVLFLALLNLKDLGYDFMLLDDKGEFIELLKQQVKTTFKAIVENESVTARMRETMYENIFYQLKNTIPLSKERCESHEEIIIKDRMYASPIETEMTEYKVGLADFGEQSFNNHCLEKIGKTIVGMANTDTDEIGYIIIGVADNEDMVNNWKAIYEGIPDIIANRFIVGIEDEAKNIYSYLDRYFQAVKDKIKSLPISQNLLEYALSNMKLLSFENHQLLVIKSKKQATDSLYDNIKYIRRGNSLERIN